MQSLVVAKSHQMRTLGRAMLAVVSSNAFLMDGRAHGIPMHSVTLARGGGSFLAKWNSTTTNTMTTLAPTISESERFHLKEQLIKSKSPHYDDDLSTPKAIATALMALRTAATTTRLDPIIDALFQRFFPHSSFSVRRMTDIDELVPLLARDKVHPIVNQNDTIQQRLRSHYMFYGMFHEQHRPIMLLQVSLQPEIPHCLDQIFTIPNNENKNPVAVFYSISLLEDGLAGLGLGERFLHAVIKDIQSRNMAIQTFVTLSPMPRFRQWLEDQRVHHPETLGQAQLKRLAIRYLVPANNGKLPIDPVARFHMSNGAQLHRVNYHPSNLQDSFGFMVNYLYDDKIQQRKEKFPRQFDVHSDLLIHLSPTQ